LDRAYESTNTARLTLPYDVPANEFMNLEGQKISGSRNWAVWGSDFLWIATIPTRCAIT
jgi:methionyl-tRNA synthetase